MGDPQDKSDNARQLEVSIGGQMAAWQIAEECPVALVYNQRNYAVMLATPDDLEDFAVGFSISERVVNAEDEIKSISVQSVDAGFDIKVEIDPARLERLDIRQKRRNLVGSASCGLCGLENADSFLAPLPEVADRCLNLPDDVISKAVQELPARQRLNAETYSVHGAAWVALDGSIELVREDIGRHNAVDKLLGARARQSGQADGFMLVSSRCSYEIIEKAARHGVRAVVSISAPTGFALDKAAQSNIGLYCWSKEGPVRLF
ncbi:formate dehydrogenase accessory sulfurtransferase FdhD [uncultured Maritalea sp.]|mgnify:CR=1 FL=1|jgi:FdhD protein|uniref:formate dehydrogenase accessory sulfurtransferase FdhD n=1 Tax=uncultured Maritalea sp. TaxID=757249 RepID=UPI002629520D|nr:formate dehydrogenase accessory sulfurtransferase FdhD [uncultured Maritalea sp.]